MVDPIRTPLRTPDFDFDIDDLIANAPGTSSTPTPARTSSVASAAPRDSFDGGTASTGRCVIRPSVFANGAPRLDCRPALDALLARLRAQPLPPTALSRVRAEPPRPEVVRDRLNDESAREGAIAAGSALAGPALGGALGSSSLGHEGVEMAEAFTTAGRTVTDTARGENVVVAAVRNQAEFTVSHLAGAVFGGAGGVGVSAMALTLETSVGGLENADQVATASHAYGDWQRERAAAGAAARLGQVEGRDDAMAADLNTPGLPSSIDAGRMQTDGDYARAVIAALEERRTARRY